MGGAYRNWEAEILAKPATRLIEVAQWVADKHALKSRSFRATVMYSTDRAVLVELRDKKQIWVPWRAVVKMEDVVVNDKGVGR